MGAPARVRPEVLLRRDREQIEEGGDAYGIIISAFETAAIFAAIWGLPLSKALLWGVETGGVPGGILRPPAPAELSRLAELEAVISKGLRTFWDVGSALL